MHPYVLKLSFGGARNRCSAQNGQTGIQPYQSTFDDGETLQGFVRPALAEFFGSLLFVLISALLGFSLLNPQLSISFYEGATIFLLMCMFGKISGGHFNPTITISIMLCGHCRIVLGICIVFMQLFGAFIGAMLARTLCAEAAYVDAFRGSILDESDRKLINRFQAFLLETLLSFIMCTAYLFTAIDDEGTNGVLCSSTVSIARAFLLETLLSFIMCTAYLFTAIDDEGTNGVLCSSTVSIARSLVSFIGYRPLGQCANIARSIASSAAASIFLLDTAPWRVLYIYMFASISGAICAALAYRISRPRPLECAITGECRGMRGG
ncbi:Aquaporin-8 [Toxocara canis]|uniref:Aquaporin-8 n=1 Tax=Toxocara canis TaxID=6265 RepID=A0A0B2UV71_TOXCA|nr:Aquaporin-8 [Toxocara canis]